MAYWHMTKKVAPHPEIAPDEEVLHACYGLSADFVALSNVAASGSSAVIRKRLTTLSEAEIWSSDFAGDSGLASALTKTGVLALTTKRLLYFAKGTVVGKPKKIVATWPLEQLTAATYSDKILRIRFSDGSIGGLHVPGSQHPKKFLAAFEEMVAGDESEQSGI
ncbi:MAG: PH domain-containing protein [Verrucomicrobiota bacterium]